MTSVKAQPHAEMMVVIVSVMASS